jgi:hypothetical protein
LSSRGGYPSNAQYLRSCGRDSKPGGLSPSSSPLCPKPPLRLAMW